MVPPTGAPALPDRMSVPCARYFAADWEASSFLEFFVDLQLRVREDTSASAGRTLSRLKDHSRFALQLTVLRSVDSYFAYFAEAERAVRVIRDRAPWEALTEDPLRSLTLLDGESIARYERSLAYANVRRLDQHFAETTNLHLFETPAEVERVSRLVVLRNVIAHGRTFAADAFASLVDETASVGGIGLQLSRVREELDFLRASVIRTDSALADNWGMERPITSAQLFETIARVAENRDDPSAGELRGIGAPE